MEIKTYVHWGEKGYWRKRLPRNKEQATEQFLKIVANKPRVQDGAEGSGGVTVFRKPLIVHGLVRGLDEFGQLAMYLVAENDQ